MENSKGQNSKMDLVEVIAQGQSVFFLSQI